MTIRDQPVFTVKIGNDAFKKLGALDQTARYLVPLALMN
jgi:hypothetical protein